MSSDGKMMINDDENKEGDGGEKPLDIGQQDILAGILFIALWFVAPKSEASHTFLLMLQLHFQRITFEK